MPTNSDEDTRSIEFVHDLDGQEILDRLTALESALTKHSTESNKATKKYVIQTDGFAATVDFGVTRTLAEYDPVRNAGIKEDTYSVGGQIQYIHIETGTNAKDRLDINVYHDGNVTIIELEQMSEGVEPRTGDFQINASSIGILRVHEALGKAISVYGDYHKAYQAYTEIAQEIITHETTK